MNNKNRWIPLILIIAVIVIPILLVTNPVLDRWEVPLYDLLCRQFIDEAVTSDCLSLILIDNNSLEWGEVYSKSYDDFLARGVIRAEDELEEGGDRNHYRWPWNRTVYDQLIQFLAEGGARAVAFDLDFSLTHILGDEEMEAVLGFGTQLLNEEGKTFVIHTLNFLATPQPPEEQLTDLERACLQSASIEVLNESQFPFDRSEEGIYYDPILPNEDMVPDALGGYLRLGAVCPQPDFDSVIRRARVLTSYQGWTFPSLGLAAALAYLESRYGPGEVDLSLTEEGLTVNCPKSGLANTIPLTPSGDILVHWKDTGVEGYAGEGRFKTYPAFQIVLSAKNNPRLIEEMAVDPGKFRVPPEAFKDQIVFIGASAVALWDLKATPVSDIYPGVKVHAAVAENILDGDPIQRLGKTSRALLAAVLATLTFLISLVLKKALWKSLLTLCLVTLYSLGSVWLFAHHLIWIDGVIPIGGVFFAYLTGLTYNFFTEGRHKREITRMFQHYVPPAVVDRLVARPDALNTRGERVEITSFFSDIKGFTTISNRPEMREKPDLLTNHLNDYLTEMTRAIHECGGTLDKYIGDAVVAFFGAPIPVADSARQACRAALACQERLAIFNERAAKEGRPALPTRIGLFTGEAMVGNVGSKYRLGYTAIGSTVNFGSRLEGVNKVYGTWIMAGEQTIQLAGNPVISRFIDRVRVPGVADDASPLAIHEVRAIDRALLEREAQLFAAFSEAMDAYQGGRFEEAQERFRSCAETFDDRPSETFSERCRILLQKPPEVWDGVWRIASK